MRQRLSFILVTLLVGCTGEGATAARQAIGGGDVPSTNASVVFLYGTAGTTCTGTVVGAHHVLAVKSCVHSGTTLAEPSSLRIYVGPDSRAFERELGVADIIATPGPPDMSGAGNELVMLVTGEPVELPILPLASVSPVMGDELTIVGYGEADSGSSGERREATLRVTAVMGGIITSEGPGALCAGDSGPAIAASGEVVGVGLFTYSPDGMSAPTCPAGSGFVDVSAHTDWLTTALAAIPPPMTDAGAPMSDAASADPDAGVATDAGGGTVMGGGCAVSPRSGALPFGLLALGGLAFVRRRRG